MTLSAGLHGTLIRPSASATSVGAGTRTPVGAIRGGQGSSGFADVPVLGAVKIVRTSAGDLVSAAARVFDITDGFTITEGPDRLLLRRREHVIEQHSASGGIWAADQERWFNPSATPNLLGHDLAVSIAQEMGRTRGPCPNLPAISGTASRMSRERT
jgi:hypothetical protein